MTCLDYKRTWHDTEDTNQNVYLRVLILGSQIAHKIGGSLTVTRSVACWVKIIRQIRQIWLRCCFAVTFAVQLVFLHRLSMITTTWTMKGAVARPITRAQHWIKTISSEWARLSGSFDAQRGPRKTIHDWNNQRPHSKCGFTFGSKFGLRNRLAVQAPSAPTRQAPAGDPNLGSELHLFRLPVALGGAARNYNSGVQKWVRFWDPKLDP